jgi:hypothetical protein
VSQAELSVLPGPQRRAIEVALLREEPDHAGGAVDLRAVAAGVRSLIVAMAVERPVLIAVDDVQWLDPASASILEFVVRRLGHERVGLVATRRLGEPVSFDLARAVAGDVVGRVRLGPLTIGALQQLLRDQFADRFPRATLLRIHQASGGNPLFALEIGRVLADKGGVAATDPLPVPGDVRELVRVRVAALPHATRDLLLAAALLAAPSVATLARALSRAVEADVEPAERERVAWLEGGVVVFAHPLHAAAVISNATTAGRRRMHLRLAEASDD